MMTDPIADMLTRIRNAGSARHAATSCPSSKQKLAIASVLQRAGFLHSVKVEERDGHQSLVLGIRYDEAGRPLIDGIQRISKPGRRVYVGKEDLPRVRNGLGVAVISTSRGVLSDREAREQNLGGELLCEVW
jgi:small subunit ribosomal protein S8